MPPDGGPGAGVEDWGAADGCGGGLPGDGAAGWWPEWASGSDYPWAGSEPIQTTPITRPSAEHGLRPG